MKKLRDHLILAGLALLPVLQGCQLDQASSYERLLGQGNLMTSDYADGILSAFGTIIISAYLFLKPTGVLIWLISWIIGFILIVVVQQSKRIRRMAIFTFLIGIPLIDFLIFYACAFYINAMYLNKYL